MIPCRRRHSKSVQFQSVQPFALSSHRAAPANFHITYSTIPQECLSSSAEGASKLLPPKQLGFAIRAASTPAGESARGHDCIRRGLSHGTAWMHTGETMGPGSRPGEERRVMTALSRSRHTKPAVACANGCRRTLFSCLLLNPLSPPPLASPAPSHLCSRHSATHL